MMLLMMMMCDGVFDGVIACDGDDYDDNDKITSTLTEKRAAGIRDKDPLTTHLMTNLVKWG